jgi:Uma2 family endonuclease
MALHVEQRSGVKRHIVTSDEYERMCTAGVFGPEARIELIRGEIVDMPPSGPEHENSVTFLNLVLVELLRRRALVWPQGNAIVLSGSNSRPQPDITILRWRDDLYRGKRPTAEDVILLVEVAQSSLKYDRGYKLALYAEAGIPEYWIVNLLKGVVELYTEPDPGAGKYQSVRIARRGETLQLPGSLEGSIAVDDVLG